ncbi:MAG: hypothetical protein FJX23_09345 [Alphaproteobacteria bacterium]|nr:hypothetical protein [Alphaproteobacteria bacterium]
MKQDASALAMTFVRIFVQKPFYFAKIFGLVALGVIFLIFLAVNVFRAHESFFTAKAEATVTAISHKIAEGSSTQNFHASFNEKEGWKSESKSEAPSVPTYHYTLKFTDDEGRERVREMDSGEEKPLPLAVGDTLPIHYSTVWDALIWSDESFAPEGKQDAGFEEGFDEVRGVLLFGIAIALCFYLFGRIGIFMTDKILLAVQMGAAQAIREQAIREQQDKENSDA